MILLIPTCVCVFKCINLKNTLRTKLVSFNKKKPNTMYFIVLCAALNVTTYVERKFYRKKMYINKCQ